MHMIDVMKKLQEIAEAGYDNEDIQRGIDAAGKHTVAEAQSPNSKSSDWESLEEESWRETPPAKGNSNDWKSLEDEEGAIKGNDDDDKDDMSPAVITKGEDGKIYPTPRDAQKAGQMKALEGADDGVEEVHEDEIDEAVVEVPVNELAELMQLAGYTDYAEKIEEYANEPDPEYMDAEEQLIGLSGGLNGPKKMYAAAAGGDNPMDQEPREVTESTFESFYKKYDKFVAELTESEQDK